MTSAKAKGTAAETAVVNYLREAGWPHVERRALSGANDQGDIAGTPGIVWEIKAGSRLAIPEWMRETEKERQNAKASFGVLVVKPKGIGAVNVHDWWAIMPLQDVQYLLWQEWC